jgi:hypothetical protein
VASRFNDTSDRVRAMPDVEKVPLVPRDKQR